MPHPPRHAHPEPQHRPLVTFFHPADWGAALSAFAEALAACPNRMQQPAATHNHISRRLVLRLRDSEELLACFVPTDEEGTVLCTLAKRSASKRKA